MPPSHSEQRAALLVAALSSFLAPFMGSSINIALPAIGAEFAMDATGLGWVASIYLVTAAAFLMPFGQWAALQGRRKVFCVGMGIYTAVSLLLVFTHSASGMLALRGLQGFGSAMMFATGMALLMSVTPPPARGKALGINVAAVYLGLSMGPFVGGFLTHRFGWRSLFLSNTIIGAFVLLVALRKLRPDPPPPKGQRFDAIGSILYAISVAAFIYGFSHWKSTPGMIASAVALCLFLFFLSWETKVQHPIINLQLFRQNTVFAMSNLAALINYSATAAVTFLLSLYLQDVLKMAPQSAGLVLVIQPAIMTVLSPIAGSLSDKMEPRQVASLGMGLTAVGLVLFAAAGQSLSLGFIVTGLGLLGLGFALFSSPNTNAVMSSVDKRLYGVASATLGTMRLTGQMLSMSVVLSIFALQMGPGSQPALGQHPHLVASMRISFVVFFVLCGAGVFASLARGKLRN